MSHPRPLTLAQLKSASSPAQLAMASQDILRQLFEDGYLDRSLYSFDSQRGRIQHNGIDRSVSRMPAGPEIAAVEELRPVAVAPDVGSSGVEAFIVERARAMLGADAAMLAIVAGNRITRVISASDAGTVVHQVVTGTRGLSLMRSTLNSTRPIRIDALKTSRYHAFRLWHRGASHLMSVKIADRGNVLGALCWIDKSVGTAFDERDEFVGSAYAEMAARAIEDGARRGRDTSFRTAVGDSLDSVLIVDSRGLIEYANPAFINRYGPDDVDPMVGQRLGIMAYSTNSAKSYAEIDKVLAEGGRWRGPLTSVAADGSNRESETIINHTGGAVRHIIRTDRDVTVERTLQSRLVRDTDLWMSIERALDSLDVGSDLPSLAIGAAEALHLLPAVASTIVFKLSHHTAEVLAATGPIAEALGLQTIFTGLGARNLRLRMEAGAYVGPWAMVADGDDIGRLLRAAEAPLVAFVPIRAGGRAVGAVGIAAHPSDYPDVTLAEQLPGLATFVAALSTTAGPMIVANEDAESTREIVAWYIRRKALTAFFQPIVRLADGSIEGWEALARLHRDQSMEWLLRRADDAGMREDLEIAAIEVALAQSAVGRGGYLSVNLSLHGLFSDRLTAVLATVGYPLVLELTEDIEVHDYPAIRTRLRALNGRAKLSVDDAGAGHSSMRHIVELRPDVVKLDMSLIRGVDEDPIRQALIGGMVQFTGSIGSSLVAEGIESAAELATLQTLGVRLGQGFLLGKPRRPRADRPWPSSVRMPR